MNKLAIIPIFFLTMCGTAPITDDPAHAFEVVVEEQHWDHVYRAIEYIKAGQREKTMTDPTDSIDSALADFGLKIPQLNWKNKYNSTYLIV